MQQALYKPAGQHAHTRNDYTTARHSKGLVQGPRIAFRKHSSLQRRAVSIARRRQHLALAAASDGSNNVQIGAELLAGRADAKANMQWREATVVENRCGNRVMHRKPRRWRSIEPMHTLWQHHSVCLSKSGTGVLVLAHHAMLRLTPALKDRHRTGGSKRTAGAERFQCCTFVCRVTRGPSIARFVAMYLPHFLVRSHVAFFLVTGPPVRTAACARWC